MRRFQRFLLALLAAGGVLGATYWAGPGAGFIEFVETTAPATPAADTLRLYAPTTAASTRLVAKDATGQTLDLVGTLFRVNVGSVTNTITETALATTTIKGNTLDAATRDLFTKYWGAYTNNSGSNRTVTYRLKYGATTVCTTTIASIPTSASSRGVLFESFLGNNGSANAQKALCRLTIFTAGLTGVSAGIFGEDTSGANSSTEDSTADKTLTFTVEHSFAAATITAQGFVFRVVLE
jgi:hypothetical protein